MARRRQLISVDIHMQSRMGDEGHRMAEGGIDQSLGV